MNFEELYIYLKAYPMLMGILKRELSNKSFLKFYKCLICNRFTHCVIALNENNSNKSLHQSNMSLDDKNEVVSNIEQQQQMMSGSFSSRSRAGSNPSSNLSNSFNLTIIANTTDLIVLLNFVFLFLIK